MLEKEIQKAKEDYAHAVKLRKEGTINRLRENMHKATVKALEDAQKKIRKAQAKYYG